MNFLFVKLRSADPHSNQETVTDVHQSPADSSRTLLSIQTPQMPELCLCELLEIYFLAHSWELPPGQGHVGTFKT